MLASVLLPEAVPELLAIPWAAAKLSLAGALRAVKEPALVAVPPGVVTRRGPVATPAGAVAIICVAELTLKDAAFKALKVTAVAPLKPVPLMVTTVPALPLGGVKLVIAGTDTTKKLLALWAVPLAVVTLIGPVLAPADTVAVICAEELTTGLTAETPLKATPLTLTKFAPLIVTLLPTGPLGGVNPLMTGAVVTVKKPALSPAPLGPVTRILPVTAPAGTVAVICPELFTTNDAETPPKLTSVVPVKFAPVMVTVVPMFPLAGVKPVMAGPAETTKLAALVAVPSGVVTAINPVAAPLGTVAEIFVEELTVNVALTPLNVTAVAPVNLVPEIVTPVPTGPVAGEKPVMVGG